MIAKVRELLFFLPFSSLLSHEFSLCFLWLELINSWNASKCWERCLFSCVFVAKLQSFKDSGTDVVWINWCFRRSFSGQYWDICYGGNNAHLLFIHLKTIINFRKAFSLLELLFHSVIPEISSVELRFRGARALVVSHLMKTLLKVWLIAKPPKFSCLTLAAMKEILPPVLGGFYLNVLISPLSVNGMEPTKVAFCGCSRHQGNCGESQNSPRGMACCLLERGTERDCLQSLVLNAGSTRKEDKNKTNAKREWAACLNPVGSKPYWLSCLGQKNWPHLVMLSGTEKYMMMGKSV